MCQEKCIFYSIFLCAILFSNHSGFCLNENEFSQNIIDTDSTEFQLTEYEPIVKITYNPSGDDQDKSEIISEAKIEIKNTQILKELVQLNEDAYNFINEIQPSDRLVTNESFYKQGLFSDPSWKYLPLTYGLEADNSIDTQPAIIFYNESANEIRIVFHGTRSGRLQFDLTATQGWSTNIEDSPEYLQFLQGERAPSYLVHGGIKRKFDSFKDELYQKLDAFLKNDRSQNPASKPHIPKIYLTGHSQGGAMANLASLYIDNYVKSSLNAKFDNTKANAIFIYALSPGVVCADKTTKELFTKTLGPQNFLQHYDKSDFVVRFDPGSSIWAKISAATAQGEPSELLLGVRVEQETSETLAALGITEQSSAFERKFGGPHFGVLHKTKPRKIIYMGSDGKFVESNQSGEDIGFDSKGVDWELKRSGTRVFLPISNLEEESSASTSVYF